MKHLLKINFMKNLKFDFRLEMDLKISFKFEYRLKVVWCYWMNLFVHLVICFSLYYHVFSFLLSRNSISNCSITKTMTNRKKTVLWNCYCFLVVSMLTSQRKNSNFLDLNDILISSLEEKTSTNALILKMTILCDSSHLYYDNYSSFLIFLWIHPSVYWDWSMSKRYFLNTAWKVETLM